MIIREAKQEDIDSIVVLLQASLGESLLKKSSEIWNFKHVLNPFGASIVLLAEEDKALIGVRAFMTWRWQIGNEIWNAYRAVDTATHPNHQGKGIFKKLTFQALDKIHEKGDCFVFNTPNDQSRPGYLKMGWQEVEKIKVALVPTFFYALPNLFSKIKIENTISPMQLEVLCETHNRALATNDLLFTPKSISYLKWRYEENPLQTYFVYSTPDCYVAMYVKKQRFFNELRVVEVIGNHDFKINKNIRKAIISCAVKNKCYLITVANQYLFAFSMYGHFGPKLTFKSLTNNVIFDVKAININNWKYSLGDLELF
ncbi:MAG: GNAT family N-acetyltransferase [Flavobacterium sp.]|nr:GNAT family N-acetyltransferase [Flavobacterium sp.]